MYRAYSKQISLLLIFIKMELIFQKQMSLRLTLFIQIDRAYQNTKLQRYTAH